MINTEELKQINGGGISIGTAGLITAGLFFLIGVVDGYVRPLKCKATLKKKKK